MSERPSANPANPADQPGNPASRLSPDLFRRTFLKLVASASAGAAIAPAFAGTAYAETGTPGAGQRGYLATTPGPGRFPLVRKGKAAPLVVRARPRAVASVSKPAARAADTRAVPRAPLAALARTAACPC